MKHEALTQESFAAFSLESVRVDHRADGSALSQDVGRGGGDPKPDAEIMTQLEIEIPIQPPRVTLHRARTLRDELEKKIRERNERALISDKVEVTTAITAVALQFPRADVLFHSLHSGWDLEKNVPLDFVGKRALTQLHELGRFIAALERKGVRHGAH